MYIYLEILTNGYKYEVLDLLSLCAILFGILVIIIKNPIVSVLFLIGLFSSIASYLIILDLSFIGLTYLIVYIGAVSILFLFILMLIDVRVSELQSNTRNSIYLGILISIFVSNPLSYILPQKKSILSNSSFKEHLEKLDTFPNMNVSNKSLKTELINNSELFNNIYSPTSNFWDKNIIEASHITSIGNIMYTHYNSWLIITSLILLLAMVGAIVITIKQQKIK